MYLPILGWNISLISKYLASSIQLAQQSKKKPHYFIRNNICFTFVLDEKLIRNLLVKKMIDVWTSAQTAYKYDNGKYKTFKSIHGVL